MNKSQIFSAYVTALQSHLNASIAQSLNGSTMGDNNNMAISFYTYMLQNNAILYNHPFHVANDGIVLSQYNCSNPTIFNEQITYPKPTQSYIGMIAMAILDSPEEKLLLSDIYKWIIFNYPYFRNKGTGWRNSIRHNLSLNECFVKSGRSASGKGHYWAVHPDNIDDFRQGNFRRRNDKRNRDRACDPKGAERKLSTREDEHARKRKQPSSDKAAIERNDSLEQSCKRRKFDIDSILRLS